MQTVLQSNREGAHPCPAEQSPPTHGPHARPYLLSAVVTSKGCPSVFFRSSTDVDSVGLHSENAGLRARVLLTVSRSTCSAAGQGSGAWLGERA